LAGGLRKKAAESGSCAFVYAAENHNHASESLEAAVFDEVPTGERDAVRARVRFGRMTNPYLGDTVERVGRNPQRKLGWDDRLVGTMRLALRENLAPRRYALGAAAALAGLDPSFPRSVAPARTMLEPLWGQIPAERHEKDTIVDLIEDERR
jgi:mannitol-1-phosphate 5-dehydrogenase